MKDAFYSSRKWRRKREKILKRDGYKCQVARMYGRTEEADRVHHIYPRDGYPEYSLCDWNLMAVSERGNNTLHDRRTGELTELGKRIQRRVIPPTPEGGKRGGR